MKVIPAAAVMALAIMWTAQAMPMNNTMDNNNSGMNNSMSDNMSKNMSMGGGMPGGGMPGGGMPGGGMPGNAPKVGGISFNKEGIKMKDMKQLNPADLSTALKSMSQSEQDTVCLGVMNGGADQSTMDNLKSAGVDCSGAMKRDPSFKPQGGQAHMVVKQMRDSKPANQWGKDDWSMVFKQMPDAVKGEDIRKMSSATLKELVQSGDMSANKDAFKGASAKRALESQLKSAYGQPSAWTNDSLSQMGSLLPNMDRKSLKQIPPAQMKAAAGTFKDMSFDDPGKKAAIGKQLIEGLGKDSAGSWSSDDIKNAAQYIQSNPNIIGKLSETALKESLSDIGARSTDKRGAAMLGKRLKAMNDFKDPTQIDSSKISQMGQLMKGMGREYLKQLPASSIQSALSTLSNISFPRGEAKELVKQIKGSVSSYNANNVKELGHLITGLEPSDLDNIPASALADSLDDIKDKDFDKSQCRAIIKKVKSAGSANLRKLGPLMSKCASPEDLDSASIDDLALNCSDSTGPSFTPDKATAKKLFKKIRARFGSPNSTNSQYSLTCFQNWGRVAALGMDAEDFDNMPDNGDLGSIFEQLSAHEADMDEQQTKAIARRVRMHLDMDNSTAVAAHDTATIAQVGVFLKHFNDTDLDKFNSTVKPDIVSKIAAANLDHMPKSEMTRMKKFAMKNVLRDDTELVTDRTNVATFDSNDISNLGNMFGGIEKSDIEKMSGDAISGSIANMGDKIRDKASKQAVWDRVDAQDSTFKNSSDNIIGSAGLVGGLPSTTLDAMDKSVLGEALSDAAAMMETRKSMDEARDKSGFSDEVADADKTAMADNVKNFVQKAFQGYQESQAASSSRRKRQTTTLTCSDVQTLGSNAVTLTTSQIETLSVTEFTDCTETLGAITGWSSSQLSSLVNEAKAAYGTSVSSWSADNVKLIGTMNAGLTDAEISTLNITSADTLSVMGTSSSFSSTQMKAGFARFLSEVRGGTASSVTGDDLISLGSFACGAESSQISQFTGANYKTAASSIGSQTTCDSTQLSAYATLAKTSGAYGASNTWDSTTMTTVGSVVGGLTSSEIGALTTTQISQISPANMAVIPPSSFAGFTTSQLEGFSSSQANSVTSSQQNSLSTSQLSSLTGAGATLKTTNQQSGATAVHASAFFLIPLIAALFL